MKRIMGRDITKFFDKQPVKGKYDKLYDFTMNETIVF